MHRSAPPARPRGRRLWWVLVAVLVVVVGAAALRDRWPASAPTAASRAAPTATPALLDVPRPERTRPARRSPPGTADGDLPGGVRVFDDEYPGVARLDAALLRALTEAAEDAARDGVTLHVNSGWRSAALQERLLREAVAEHGSAEEAARWVATADTSPHVSGDAVDIGRADATDWLAEHGAAYGLCRIYRNEPWHYELRAGAARSGCPRPYADPTRDPRMQR